jgi:lysophospholipase L1-like esterase
VVIASAILICAGSASSTAAARPAAARYVALGDSYSSGEGNPPFIRGTKGECDRSNVAYGPLVKRFLKIEQPSDFSFHACSGAMMADFVADLGGHATGQYAEGAQLDQIAPAGKPSLTTRLVTLSVGGNDAGFAFAVSGCVQVDGIYVSRGTTCAGATDTYADLGTRLLTRGGRILVTTKDNSWQFCDAACARAHASQKTRATVVVTVPSLAGLYEDIQRRAPNARIRVLLYPHLFPSMPTTGCLVGTLYLVNPVGFAPADMVLLNAAADRLDAVIGAQVAKARSAGVEIAAVDSRPDFAAAPGHGLCDGAPWINPVTFTDAWWPTPERGSFHPTAAGQSAFASELEASLGQNP